MNEPNNKLWQKDQKLDEKIETFTVGKDRELDLLLAEFDVLGSLAHIRMLQSIGLLTEDEFIVLERGLSDIYQTIKRGVFTIENGVEDVHSQVELMLTREYGDVGKKIHSGRSRNDQVLLDLKLFMRYRIMGLAEQIEALFNHWIGLSEKYKNVLMPGYTHMQIAMPSSFGLWFGAYAESLTDDVTVLRNAFEIINRNPLGSAAGYGSSFPLNRQMTTDLLGFSSMNCNVVYAQMGRGKAEKILANAMGIVADTVGKFAMDVTLYLGQNHGFINFPEEYTTGSSIMPHKKNPDVFELIRAHCNKIKALPNEISMITTNLPQGYHRDLQLIKETFLPAIDELSDCLDMTRFMLGHIEVREDILKDDKYKFLFSVELVNKLVLEGMPFRDAYREVGKRIAEGSFDPPREVHHVHEGSIGNLCHDEIRIRMEKTLRWFWEVDRAINLQMSDLVNELK